jgi:hypothetical protein
MSGGKKNDNKKPRVDLIPIEFTIGTAKALTYGADKYGEHNFREGIDFARLLAAAKRHLELEIAGIEIDKDSNNEHWMHVAASIAMYAFMKKNRPDLDNRYKYTDEQKEAIEKMMYGEGE